MNLRQGRNTNTTPRTGLQTYAPVRAWNVPCGDKVYCAQKKKDTPTKSDVKTYQSHSVNKSRNQSVDTVG